VARSFRPEVVFLDTGVPGIDGWEVVRRLPTQSPRAGVKIGFSARLALAGGPSGYNAVPSFRPGTA